MKLICGALLLFVLPQSAAAQACSEIAGPRERLECLIEGARRRTAERLCAMDPDEASRARCYRAWGVQWSMDNLCDTEALKTDRVACLERRVEALTKELTDLRRELPRLIEEGVKAAMQPRLHRNSAAPEAR